MRSWVKALLISAITLLVLIIFLPNLAKPMLNSLLPWALKQSNAENIEINISSISWNQLTLDNFSFSNPSTTDNLLTKFSLQQLSINYNPFKLLSGHVTSIKIDQLSLTMTDQLTSKHTKKINGREQQTLEYSIKEIPALPNAKEIFEKFPMETFEISNFSIIHPVLNINGQVSADKEKLNLESTFTTSLLNQPLTHKFSFNNKGKLITYITLRNSTLPIFNLQAEWSEYIKDQENKNMLLSLQQSADLKTWLSLINSESNSSKFLAATAIQAWHQEILIPKYIKDPKLIIQSLSGEGYFQLKINDFNTGTKDTSIILSKTNLSFNATTLLKHSNNIDHKKWQIVVEDYDLKGTIHAIDELSLYFQQQLNKPLNVTCDINSNNDFECSWKGELQQSMKADNINSEITTHIAGNFKDALGSGSAFNSRQVFDLNIQQNNERWPRLNNKTSGELVFHATKNLSLTGDDFWHWQLNLPFGLNSKTDYFEPLPASFSTGILSSINWQLLPDWQLKGIDTELTNAKAFNILIKNLKWADTSNPFKRKNKSIMLETAELSCTLDWLKLQYSPQLRSNTGLKSLPLECEWNINNAKSEWEEWPIPTLKMVGSFQFDSLDFKNNKMRTEVKLTGLNKQLDLSLHAQHDFSGLQKGAAQLYLNSLNLDWSELGLVEMLSLTQAQLFGGTLSAQGWIQWEQYQEDIFDDKSIAWRWQPDFMLRADDIAGVYNNTTAWDDVDFQMAIRRPFYKNFKIVSQISANSINPGINISNILARSTTTVEADLSKALIVIEEIHSDALGGQIKVPLIRFDTSQKINAFGIEVEGLQISQLAELEAGSGIRATGTLDGVLPIILLPEGPQVPAGSLYARVPGGVINYKNDVASTLKNSDPSVGLVMQVLEDFHYNKLQTNVTYQPNGELRLGLQFQGKNPTFFEGQSTHLNLNLDYNLLDLLESLRISNDIVQKLENKYQ